jgi:hypothetical protein
MTSERQVDYMLADCFFAAGQAVASRAQIAPDAIAWWRDRYHPGFTRAIELSHAAWDDDRERLLGVSRFLGHRAVDHAGDTAVIDRASAVAAALEIEAGCRLRARERPDEGAGPNPV